MANLQQLATTPPRPNACRSKNGLAATATQPSHGGSTRVVSTSRPLPSTKKLPNTQEEQESDQIERESDAWRQLAEGRTIFVLASSVIGLTRAR